MKKKLLGLAFILFIAGVTKAQEVVSNGGGEGETSSVSVSWTIGEPVIETISNSNTTLTQGFQQSKLEIINVSEKEYPEYKVNVFPNPTSDYFTVNIDGNDSEVELVLSNMDGRIIHSNKMFSEVYTHSVNSYNPGTYLLRIIKGNKVAIYKLIKK